MQGGNFHIAYTSSTICSY